MKLVKIIFWSLSLILLTTSCEKNIETTPSLEITGIVQEYDAPFNSFQKGTHTIANDTEGYFIISYEVNLDDYINKTVTIVAEEKWHEYSSSEYLEVSAVK